MTLIITNDWEQLTVQQAFSIVQYMLEGKSIASKMRILEAMLPLEAVPIYAQLKAEKIHALLPLVDWTFQKPIIRPHLEYFVIDEVKFFLPDTTFKNVHLIEYSYATDAYNDIMIHKNPSAINRLIACLCRPERSCDRLAPDYNGDPREKFNPELLDHYTSLIQHLPVEFKCYFIKYFESCADYVVEQFKPLFTPSAESSEGANKPNFGWLGFIMALADTGVFGNFEQTQYTNIYTALAYRLKKFYDEKDLK